MEECFFCPNEGTTVHFVFVLDPVTGAELTIVILTCDACKEKIG